MAETSGPFDAGGGANLTEADWELMLQHLIDGVYGGYNSNDLRATASGSTARGVDIATGWARCRGHWYKSDAVKTLTSAANGAGSARIDRAVLRLHRTNNVVTTELVQGTAGAGTPALTDTATVTEMPLWRWTIAPGATTATAITDERNWLGSVIRPCSSTNRPARPIAGEIAREMDTGRWIGYTGSGWVILGPTADSGEVVLPINTAIFQYDNIGQNAIRNVGGLVTWELSVLVKAGQSWTQAQVDGGSVTIATVPAAFRADRLVCDAAPISHNRSARLDFETGGAVKIRHINGDLTGGMAVRTSGVWHL